jgi:hypothetical protein
VKSPSLILWDLDLLLEPAFVVLSRVLLVAQYYRLGRRVRTV